MERPAAYIPTDRRHALARGKSLPDRTNGAALFADISGFTPLTEALARELGPQRGAEELTHHLNDVYDVLIAELDTYGGSVVGFSGDAITCWFNNDSGLRATACALVMQQSMKRFEHVAIPSGQVVSLAMKAAVATGKARRFLVGDPQIQVIDVLAGAVVDRLAAGEHIANKGEVVLDPSALSRLGGTVKIISWREDEAGQRYGIAFDLNTSVKLSPWNPLPDGSLTDVQIRPWLLPPVYERLYSGQGEFLAELRPAVALFLRFGGIDYDSDESAVEKLDAYIRQVQHILTRYEGSLLQLTIGDKGSYLYAAFGAPKAHEDEAVRALSAAIELRNLSSRVDFITDVQIGVTQGRVRTGAYGGVTRRTYGVQGDNVNLSARLMQAAPPGDILVSKAAKEASESFFLWEDLPPIKVKGKTEPIVVYRLIGRNEQNTIRLQEPKYALPMVGRELQLGQIEEKLSLALLGHGQIVGITAEAGMGKSRLLAEVVHRADNRKMTAYGGECQSYGTNTSYLVWQPIWQNFFGIDNSWEADVQIHALTDRLAQIDSNLLLRLPLLGSVLNITIPDNDLTRTFDAKVRKTSLEALLLDCLRARSRETPLLFILEDCHWLDPLSLELLEILGRAIVSLPVALIMAYRPAQLDRPNLPHLSQLAHFTEILLSDFTPQEAELLIQLKLKQFFGLNIEIPRSSIDRITWRAQGNPFYIEELLNYLQDRGVNPQDSHAFEQLDLPATLQSLILSRIDKLTESQKTTLKVASVIGRLFKASMIWGVYPQIGEYKHLLADLESLRQLDLTPLDTPEPELTYIFKHILTQEVAYESLLYATRATLHEQIGQFIEKTYQDRLDQYIDLLAFHYDRSPNEQKRRQFLFMAAQAAQTDYANVAAIDYYQRVIPLLVGHDQVMATVSLGQVQELTGNWSEAEEQYHHGLSQAESLDDRLAQAQCQTILGELLRKQGNYSEAQLWQEKAKESFENLSDQAGVAQTLQYAGTLAAQQGDLETARSRYQESLELQRKLGDKPRIASLLSNLGILACFQSDYPLGKKLYEESLEIRREVQDKRAIANSLSNLGNLALEMGDYNEARSRLDEAVMLQRQVGDLWAIANSLNNLGNVYRTLGEQKTARNLYNESLGINRDLGDLWAIAYLLEDIGILSLRLGRPERALSLAGASSELRQKIGAPLSPADQTRLEEMLAPARKKLNQSEQETAWNEGKGLTLDQAIDMALEIGENSKDN
jgi:adenylate cyclase